LLDAVGTSHLCQQQPSQAIWCKPAANARRVPRLSVIRNAGAERELTMMRWGMPPPRAGAFPVTNIRNTPRQGSFQFRRSDADRQIA
jgi:putative SOS response-associated peptidase YedK